jgi:hypothetical protein
MNGLKKIFSSSDVNFQRMSQISNFIPTKDHTVNFTSSTSQPQILRPSFKSYFQQFPKNNLIFLKTNIFLNNTIKLNQALFDSSWNCFSSVCFFARSISHSFYLVATGFLIQTMITMPLSTPVPLYQAIPSWSMHGCLPEKQTHPEKWWVIQRSIQ